MMVDARPETLASQDDLLGQVMGEVFDRLAVGEAPDLEACVARYPSIADLLRQALPPLMALSHSLLESPGSEAEIEPRPQQRLGDFHILREIGRGGMGVVYEAAQLSMGRNVALKVLPFAAMLDPKALRRFQNEVRAAATLDHPHIVPVYSVGEERGIHYYAMHLIRGPSLATLLEQLRALGRQRESTATISSIDELVSSQTSEVAPADNTAGRGTDTSDGLCESADTDPQAAATTSHAHLAKPYYRSIAGLGIQVAEALAHAHEIGIVHRDVKPGNLLLDSQGQLFVTDFGLARIESQAGTTISGDIVGTLRYMSPEQALGQPALVDHRTDIYSLGATLYELLTLQPVVRGCDRRELLQRIAHQDPTPLRQLNRAVPRELETIVLKCLAKEPTRRYTTAQQVADDLRRFLQDEPIQARRPSVAAHVAKWARRHRAAVVSMASISIIVLVAAAVVASLMAARERELAQSAQRVNEGINQALTEVTRIRLQGTAERPDSPDWITEAHEHIQRAIVLSEGGGTTPELRERVAQLSVELQQEKKDLQLLADLDRAWSAQTELDANRRNFDLGRAGPWLRQALQAYGVVIGEGEPATVAAWIGQRPERVRMELLSAMQILSDLQFIRAGSEEPQTVAIKRGSEQAWLRAVVRAAETDPWRRARLDSREITDPNEKRAAIDKLAESTDRDSQPARALTDLAAELHLAGLRGRAIELLKRTHDKHPDNFWVNEYLALFLQLVQPPQTAEALRYATAALALRPESPGVRVNLGIALQDLNRYDEAIAQFREAARLRPDYATAYNQLGSVLDDQGKLDEAVAMYRRALEIAPNDALTYHNLGYTLARQNKIDESSSAYREAIRLNPRNPMTHNNLGGQLFDQGKLEEAAVEFRAALQLDDQLAMAHHNLGRLLAEREQWDEAVTHYRKAVAANPDCAETYNLLGIALAESGHLDEAASIWAKAIELEPDNVNFLHNLAEVLLDKGPEEAVQLATRAVELEPENGGFYNTLGVANYRAGRWQDAIHALQKSLELTGGGDANDWFFLAMACWQLGDQEQGRTWYEKAAAWTQERKSADEQLRRFWAEAAELLGEKKPDG